jgi:hypothetical protein
VVTVRNDAFPAGTEWRKSSHSGVNECVEVRGEDHGVFVRDSKKPHGLVLALPRETWRAFLRGVKAGDLD